MTGKQKKLIEQWLVLGVLIGILVVFQDSDWEVQWAFLPMLIYLVLNWAHVEEFQRRSLKPMEIIERSRGTKYWVYGSSLILLLAAIICLSSGLNILDHLGIGALLLLVSLPLLPAVISSQIILYKELANEL